VVPPGEEGERAAAAEADPGRLVRDLRMRRGGMHNSGIGIRRFENVKVSFAELRHGNIR